MVDCGIEVEKGGLSNGLVVIREIPQELLRQRLRPPFDGEAASNIVFDDLEPLSRTLADLLSVRIKEDCAGAGKTRDEQQLLLGHLILPGELLASPSMA